MGGVIQGVILCKLSVKSDIIKQYSISEEYRCRRSKEKSKQKKE